MRGAKLAYAATLLAVVWPAHPSAATGAPPTKGWAVLPARGERPPPRDPTLMRLSDALARAIEGAVGAEVVVVDRAMAEEACPGEGDACPRDVAILVSAARVVSIVLLEDQSAVDLRVYAPRVGLERTVQLACQWQEGLLACDTADLAQKLEIEPKVAAAPAARAPTAKARPRASAIAPATDAVSQAFAAAAPRLGRCAKEG